MTMKPRTNDPGVEGPAPEWVGALMPHQRYAESWMRSRSCRKECERKLSWKLKWLQPLWFDDVAETTITPREKGADMSSVLRSVRKRKKGRTLGAVDVIDRAEYAELEVDAKVS